MDDVVIVAAARTPIGTFMGSLSSVPAHKLAGEAITAALRRAQIDPSEVDQTILGQVLTSGQGQNTARQAAVEAGISIESTAMVVNQVCGSGLRAIALGMQQILTGDSNIVVAGGQENMSLAPHCQHFRGGAKMGAISLVDTMVCDGLTDAFGGYHMGITAENVASDFNISRQTQDEFALNSQCRAAAAQREGRFDEEIVPITVETGKRSVLVENDEHIRKDVSAAALAALRPAFIKDGTVTAGNASGLNDGAAAVILMRRSQAHARGLEPLASIKCWAMAGVDPSRMGTGPIPASRNALMKAGWHAHELDLVEANEAFAAQACAVNMAMDWDATRVNVNGGAIALGHPIGASGARILVTLVHEMRRRNARKALATLCIGGGMGIAMCVER